MAAYAALVSVVNIINQLNLHPRPPISLHKQQAQRLTTIISFLQHFLEGYTSHPADHLEGRIADAAYAAEDVIESHILDQILAGSRHDQVISSTDQFYDDLERVMEEMDWIMKDVMQIKETAEVQDQLHRLSFAPASSSRSAAIGRSVAMVGVDVILIRLLEMLTSGKPDRLTISITGMGGMGKTALARNIYENQVVAHHFDILAWVSIPREYRTEEILFELVLCLEESRGSMENVSSEEELGEMLYKRLSGRRYLIIIDDLWDVEVWDKLQNFFPNNKNESRIMITTRLANLASQLCGSYSVEMSFLDENDSWNLLCKNVFENESWPRELEETGKLIARNCKGLPLSIVVIGGLLRKAERSPQYWDYIAKNLNQIVNLVDEERCLQILYTSYDQLPVHLKPCFLYMGVFLEDSEVNASELIRLWVAEGFLKPIQGKSLEEAGEEYLKELVDRNLILFHKRTSTGKIKSCKLHNLLRDLCSREADKHKFVGIIRQRDDPRGRITQRRLCVHQWDQYLCRVLHNSEYYSRTRSLIWDSCGTFFSISSTAQGLDYYLKGFTESLNPRLLRVFKVLDLRFLFISKEMKHIYFKDSVSKLLNLRYISYPQIEYSFPPTLCRLWNLQTLIARHTTAVAPPEIWKMPLLRHLQFYNISLPDPPCDPAFVLDNLNTLFTITIWDCRHKVVERIPNIKKLKICQGQLEGWSVNYLNNLGRLHKLESLEIGFASFGTIPSPLDLLTFPHSLMKLTLYGTRLPWGDMATKIGSLPLLQVLKLKWDSFVGSEWETFEGQFCSLKSLLIDNCGLVYWTTDNTHFPCLEHLQLGFLKELKEIPFAIGEIPTLQSIKLVACSTPVVVSAKGILEDQRDNYGNDVLQLHIDNFLSYMLHIG